MFCHRHPVHESRAGSTFPHVLGRQPRGKAEIRTVVSGVCALQTGIVEELPAFIFRTKSLSKMSRQKN